MPLLNLCYPDLCLHCGDPAKTLFCVSCQTLLEIIDPNERCVTCFSEKEKGTLICLECRGQRDEPVITAALFEYMGPMMSLTCSLKFQKMGYLAKRVAPFFVIQLEKLGWEWPDIVTYVPRRWLKNLIRGYNQSFLLARSFCQLTNLPLVSFLKHTGGNPSQVKLSKKERRKLPSSQFELKREVALANKRVLIIDDVITTGATTRACAAALKQGNPGEVRVLGLCRALLTRQ